MEFVLLSVFILSLRPCYQQWYILYILYLVVLYIAQQRTQTIVVPFTYISLKRGVLRFSFPFYFSFRLTLTSSRASLVLFRPSFRPSFFGFSRASPLLSAYITFSSTLRTTNTIVTILTFHLTTLLVSLPRPFFQFPQIVFDLVPPFRKISLRDFCSSSLGVCCASHDFCIRRHIKITYLCIL